MTEFTGNGLQITAQDLSSLTLSSEDDGRMFHHDGSSTIELAGGATEGSFGFYIWDNQTKAWYPPFNSVDKLDGKHAGAFLHRDGSLAMQAALDMGNYGLINVGEAKGGTGGIHLNDNHVELHSHTTGANIRLSDTNGLLIAEAIEGGNFNVPNGQLQEQGLRVATRSWSDTRYYNVSGDSLSGVLDVATNDVVDGTTTVWDTSIGAVPQSSLGGPAASLSAYPLANTDVANSSVTVTAGNQLSGGGTMSLGGTVTVDVDEGSGSGLDADLLDGLEGSAYVHTSGDTMSGLLTVDSTGDAYKVTSANSDDHFWSLRDVSTSAGADEARLIARDTTNAVTSLAVDLDATNGRLDVSTGTLAEAGNRVATRAWTTGGNILAADLGFDTATQSELNNHSGTSGAHHTKTATSDVDSTNWSDYEIQKNGTDGSGIINFKT